MRVITVLLLVFLCSNLISQPRQGQRGSWRGQDKMPEITISGKVMDLESELPIEYATISIFNKKDSTLISGGLTDEQGNFSVKSRPGRLYANLDYLSYKSVTIDPIPLDREQMRSGNFKVDLGTITMEVFGVQLDQVEIRAEKSETQFTLDKKVFNVGKDLANKGGTAEDILDNVPSVTVDIDGNVSLRGSTGVRILIDGRPSGLVGVDNANGLRQLPANLIEKVEVITNPSARYEAEGMAGIINIVLKKDDRSGWNGALDLTAGIPQQYGIGGNVNYRKGDINWFANYSLRYRTRPGEAFQYQELYSDDTTFITDQVRTFDRESVSNSFRGGLDYYLSDKENITASFLYRFSDEDNLNSLTYDDYINDFPGNYIGRTIRTDDEKEEDQNLEYSLDYRKEFSSRQHTLNATVQYRDRAEVENSDFNESYFNSSGLSTGDPDLVQRSENDEGQETWLFQVDYTHPISKDHRWEVGARTSLRHIRNEYLVEEWADNQWINLDGLSNDFDYNEDIHAVYGIYGNKFGRFSFQSGLRAEWSLVKTELLQTSELNDREYLDFFPSLHLNYELGNNNAIQLSYSKRTRRPRFWDLNPFFTFSDSRNFFSGNPNLDPEFTDSYEIGHIKYWDSGSISSSIFHRHTEGVIQRIRTVDAEGIGTTMPENLDTRNDLGVEFIFSYSGIKWLRLDGNTNLYWTETIGEGFREDFNSESFTWFARLTSRFSFWDNSDLQVRFNYRGPRESPQGKRKGMAMVDLGWSKDFLNNNLTLTLGVRDLFNSRKRKYESFEEGNFFTTGEFQWRSRTASLTASYRFNQKKKRQSNRGQGNFDQGGEGIQY